MPAGRRSRVREERALVARSTSQRGRAATPKLVLRAMGPAIHEAKQLKSAASPHAVDTVGLSVSKPVVEALASASALAVDELLPRDPAGAGVARAPVDHDDDALLTPGSERRDGAHPRAGCAGSRQPDGNRLR